VIDDLEHGPIQGEFEEDPNNWYTDRSRFMLGYECPWKRLLRFHAFGTGIELGKPNVNLAIGIHVHKTLEHILETMRVRGDAIDQKYTEHAHQKTLKSDACLPVEELMSLLDGDTLQHAVDISYAIPHAYARIAVPWLKENFEIKYVEPEYIWRHTRKIMRAVPPTSLDVDGQDQVPGRVRDYRRICFNSRPDFVAIDKSTERYTQHDFKTAASFQQDREVMGYADNVQMMLNSMQVKADQNLNYFPDYYVHILLKGNDWSPSPLTTAYRRDAIPPFQTEDWQPKYWLPPLTPGGKKRSIGRAYSKVRVGDHRPVPDWVWSMPAQICAEQVIILGPFNVVEEKVVQFMRGLPDAEEYWLQHAEGLDWREWDSLDFQHLLDMRFPRTFNCYSYGHRCQFYNLCFKGPGWEDPFKIGYVEREPHHTTEPKKELIR
jgi:hypothetical protein